MQPTDTSDSSMRASALSPKVRKLRPLGLLVGTIAMTFALLVGNVGAANASSANISGTQNEFSNVYWSTARSNTYTRNYMRISPYYGTQLGIPALTVGARWISAPSASFAKTPAIPTTGAAYFALVSSGSTYISPSTFYLTTYLGASGCGCSEALTWSAVLYYNVAA